MAAKPTRLTKNRHGTFSIRWIVPVHLRERGDARREVRFSLRTTDSCKARILALEFNLALERLRATMTKDSDPRAGITPLTLEFGPAGLKADIQNDNDARLFKALLSEHSDMREAMLQSIRGGTPAAVAMGALVEHAKAATAAVVPVERPMLMTEGIKHFTKTMGSDEPAELNSRSTPGEKLRTTTLLLEFLESIGCSRDKLYVHEIRRPDILAFVDHYAARPSKAARSAEAARKRKQAEAGAAAGADGSAAVVSQSIEATAESSGGKKKKNDTIRARTIKKGLGHIEAFFAHAEAHEWIATNPIDSVFQTATAPLRKTAAGEKQDSHYDLYDEAEIEKIFDPEPYMGKLNAADEFWAPLIALYTGARAAEIVTLETANIFFDDESQVWVMDITKEMNDGDGPKNKNSIRKVPLPGDLLDLGFIDYVRKIQAFGARMLFPHRPPNPTRESDPSKHLSRVYSEHLLARGVKTPKKVFHSFRHTVITRMHVLGVPVADAELIVGHAAQDGEVRLRAAQRFARPHGSTHLPTYVNAAAFAQDKTPLLLRLHRHMTHSLQYDLDFAGLRHAAHIVTEHTVKRSDVEFKSGWHTNNKKLCAFLLEQVAQASRAKGQLAPDA